MYGRPQHGNTLSMFQLLRLPVLHSTPFLYNPTLPSIFSFNSSLTFLTTTIFLHLQEFFIIHPLLDKMCSSNSKSQSSSTEMSVSHINGRPVLQPYCNRTPLLDRRNSLKKPTRTAPPSPASSGPTTPPVSPKLKSPRQPAAKRGNDANGLGSIGEKVVTPRSSSVKAKKVNKGGGGVDCLPTVKYSSAAIVEAPGSIAAARREQVAVMQEQRKMRIAHYGRTKSAKYERKVVPIDNTASPVKEERRCHFITSNSDPIYIAYHDEEWGVPVHDDKVLFELLVLTGAQVGSDWTTVLKRRQDFRDAFEEFDAELVSKFSEKKIVSVSSDYNMEMSQVRGVVDNASRILEIKRQFGSFDKYLWTYVNHKPIATQYRSCLKIPVKTSKSESISKDMVRRGFRFVGPTVVHSFMQAAGLTNDHLINCPRHLQCVALASHPQT